MTVIFYFNLQQTSLKKDRLIDEQLNGDEVKSPGAESLADEMEMNHSVSSKFSSKSASHSQSHSEDEEVMKPNMAALPLHVRESSIDHHSSGSSSPNSNSQSSDKFNRREALLKRLKQVEEAIERKLNKKKD